MSQSKSAVNRRDFVQKTAAASAAVSLFHLVGTKQARAANDIRVGLIGCGGRGKGALKDVIRAAEIAKPANFKIVALADLFEDNLGRAQELLDQFDRKVDTKQCFTGWDAYKKLLATDCNYVMICIPPVFRPMAVEAAVEAGKNIFMEKPAAVDPPGIRRIIAAGEKAKSKGLSLVAGTQRRHQGEYIDTIERIHSGVIGDILSAQATWCTGPIMFRERKPGMSDMEWQIRSWYHFLWLSGDHIVEQHVHNLDVVNWALGDHPVKAYGHGSRGWQQRGNIWDHHAVKFTYANGATLFSLCSQFPRPDSRVEEFVQGTKGVSNCSNWIKVNGGEEWKNDKKYENPYVQEHVDLIQSIQNDKPRNEAKNVATSTMTAIMGRMAEYSGKEMTWDEAYNSNETLGQDEYKLGPVELRPVAIPGGAKYTGTEGWNPG